MVLRKVLPALLLTTISLQAMEIVWTRTTGQWPVEASPLVIKSNLTGKDEILLLNRGGQLLLWDAEGLPLGSGQDGMVSQLPAGRWTTAPTLIANSSGTRFVVASVEGKVIGLDPIFQRVWEHQLSGQTVWGRAIPAVLQGASGETRVIFSDLSGTLTCLSMDGQTVWTNAPGLGSSKAPAQVIKTKSGESLILFPAGSTLSCYEDNGKVRWKRVDLGPEIVTRPEALSLPDRDLILCGSSSGRLFALGTDGEIRWERALGDPLSHSLTCLFRRERPPLILF